MSNGTKFWGSHSAGHNRVIMRKRGDIPGITPAYDVFVNIPLEDMRAATAERANRFCELLMECGGTVEFKTHPFHSTDVLLSVIRNPSTRVRNTWDWDYRG